MGKMGCVVGAVIVGVIALLALWAGGLYNGLVGSQQEVEAQWAQVENVYQRRADLIPNLVRTVQGAANFERGTLRDVVEARSRVGQVNAQATSEILNDPARFQQFQQAQDQLSSALSRLLVVVERYPELKAVAGFQELQSQLEGTENRIAVERRRFNEVAQSYNTKVRRVPASWFISALGWPFQPKPYFQSQPGAATPPTVDFGPQQ